jgi:glycosyltransferase involved in cell wall biosynthesis
VKIRFLLHDVYGQGGGVVTVTFALAEELAKRHDVELISAFGRGPSVHRLPAGVRVVSLAEREGRGGPVQDRVRAWASRRPSRVVPEAEPRYRQYSLHSDLVLRRYLRSLDDGVLVTMQPGLNLAAARFGRDTCVRVAQDHRPFVGRPRQLIESYARHARKLDAFLTLTKADAQKYRKVLGRDVLIRAIGNGTPAYEGPQSDQSSRTVVAAGRLSRTKGFDILIDSWSHVAAAHPDWKLEIWGEGDLRAELTRQIADLGLTDHVELKGFSKELQSEMARASIFVLSSRAEGYPRVILEAMACGVPVVSTDCPSGPREMIDSGVDGVLVPSKDPVAQAGAINELIERGPEGRRAMGQAGLDRTRRMSQAVVARRWEELFAELAEHRQGSASPVR